MQQTGLSWRKIDKRYIWSARIYRLCKYFLSEHIVFWIININIHNHSINDPYCNKCGVFIIWQHSRYGQCFRLPFDIRSSDPYSWMFHAWWHLLFLTISIKVLRRCENGDPPTLLALLLEWLVSGQRGPCTIVICSEMIFCMEHPQVEDIVWYSLLVFIW